MTRNGAPGGARTHGWGVSLRLRGRTLVDRRVRADAGLRIGEDPGCDLVVPGLGGAALVAVGERLLRVPGLSGTVHRAGEAAPFGPEVALAPGDRAELTIDAHPEIALELRREQFERLPLATLVNVRELARQLALGAGLVAGMVLLVRHQTPVNTLEVKGDPDAPEDSALVRAMFVAAAVVPPPPELHLYERWMAPPAPPAALEPGPPEPVAPLPINALAGVEVPVPVMEVDEQPKSPRKRRSRAESDELMEIGAIYGYGTIEDGVFGVINTVEGGVEGGVVGGVIGDDLLANSPGVGGLGLVGVGTGGMGEGVAEVAGEAGVGVDVVDVVETVEKEVVVENADFVENIMGPGADEDVPGDRSGSVVPGVIIGEAPPPEQPPQQAPPGENSHPEAGGVVVYGVPAGLAAVAPEGACEDPAQQRKKQLDVVFVVDVSTTMNFMLDSIERQLPQIDGEARAQGLDPRYGLVVFVDDVELGNAGQAYADLTALQRDLARWRAFTASNRQIGSAAANVDWPENTLDAVHAAATGFAWRPADATLRMIVHATDDDFGEAPAVQSGLAVKHTYVEVAAALRNAEVRMFSFAAKIGGQCECLDVRPGLFTRFHGRPSLPNATGGAVFDIDEVATGKLGFTAAVAGAIKSGVCTRYPLSPFAGAKP